MFDFFGNLNIFSLVSIFSSFLIFLYLIRNWNNQNTKGQSILPFPYPVRRTGSWERRQKDFLPKMMLRNDIALLYELILVAIAFFADVKIEFFAIIFYFLFLLRIRLVYVERGYGFSGSFFGKVFDF